jgi:hypothetical protein
MLRSIVSRVFTITELAVSKHGHQRLIHTKPLMVASKGFLKPMALTLRPLGSVMQVHDTKAKGAALTPKTKIFCYFLQLN